MLLNDSYRLLLKVLFGDRWDYYNDTKEYADKLHFLASNDKESKEALLERFIRREDPELFKQRLNFTQLVTPAIYNRIRVPFSKIMRNDDIRPVILPAEASKEIETNFYSGKPILNYIDTVLKDQIFLDPNAHVAITFDSYNLDNDKPSPYPILYGSEQCLYRVEDKKGNLETLVVETENKSILLYTKSSSSEGVEVPAGKEKLSTFSVIEARIVEVETPTREVQSKDGIDDLLALNHGHTVKIKNDVYEIRYFEQGVDKIPVTRVGYWLDSHSKNKTCISPIHYSIPRMMKTIKNGSELDLSTALHAFPQKVQLVEPCKGFMDDDTHRSCNDGYYYDDKHDKHICKNCNGSGYEPVHNTAADVVYVKNSGDPEEQMDPTKMVHYISTDVETPKFQNEYVNQLEQQCVKDVFASNSFSLAEKETATNVAVSYESVYDAISPFKDKVSELFRFIALCVSKARDVKAETIQLAFPSDLKLKPAGDLIEEIKATEGVVPPSVRKTQQEQLIHKLLQNQPIQRNRELIKLDLYPFSGYGKDEIAQLLTLGTVSDLDKFIHSNFYRIIEAIEVEDDKFYDKNREERGTIFRAKAESLRPTVVLPREGDE